MNVPDKFVPSHGEIRVATFLGEVYQSFCHLPRGALEAHLLSHLGPSCSRDQVSMYLPRIDAGLGVVLHEAHVHLVSSNVEPSDLGCSYCYAPACSFQHISVEFVCLPDTSQPRMLMCLFLTDFGSAHCPGSRVQVAKTENAA